jgi:copper chaperone CopZ
MKHRRWPGLILPVLLAFSAPASRAADAAPSGNKEPARKETTLTIKGMTCGGCVAAVKLKLRKTKGVLAYEVSLERGEADVTYDPDLTKPETIAAAVSETGFAATVKAKADPPTHRPS